MVSVYWPPTLGASIQRPCDFRLFFGPGPQKRAPLAHKTDVPRQKNERAAALVRFSGFFGPGSPKMVPFRGLVGPGPQKGRPAPIKNTLRTQKRTSGPRPIFDGLFGPGPARNQPEGSGVIHTAHWQNDMQAKLVCCVVCSTWVKKTRTAETRWQIPLGRRKLEKRPQNAPRDTRAPHVSAKHSKSAPRDACDPKKIPHVSANGF